MQQKLDETTQKFEQVTQAHAELSETAARERAAAAVVADELREALKKEASTTVAIAPDTPAEPGLVKKMVRGKGPTSAPARSEADKVGKQGGLGGKLGGASKLRSLVTRALAPDLGDISVDAPTRQGVPTSGKVSLCSLPLTPGAAPPQEHQARKPRQGEPVLTALSRSEPLLPCAPWRPSPPCPPTHNPRPTAHMQHNLQCRPPSDLRARTG